MAFLDQIQGANTNLGCRIQFLGSDPDNVTPIQLTTSDIDSPNYRNYPILKSFPSIKESINIETRKYSISSVKLSIYNADIENHQKFSDLLDTDHFRINQPAIIKYFANNRPATSDSYIAYKGKIKYTSHCSKSDSSYCRSHRKS